MTRPDAGTNVQSWIIDGFPRTLHQGELLDTVLNEEVRSSLIVTLAS